MKIIVISGSRDESGRTAKAACALIKGAESEGAQCELIFLPQMKVERCRQCEKNGWGLCKSEGRCTIEDDFAPLVEKIKSADAAVFANPVYFSDLSESLRAFLDRLRRTTRHEDGKKGLEGKRAVGVCVAGGGGGGAPACTVSLERAHATTGFDVQDVVPARRQNLDGKLVVLEATGRWFASALAAT